MSRRWNDCKFIIEIHSVREPPRLWMAAFYYGVCVIDSLLFLIKGSCIITSYNGYPAALSTTWSHSRGCKSSFQSHKSNRLLSRFVFSSSQTPKHEFCKYFKILFILYLFRSNDRRLDSNALICDCQLLWLAKMLNEKQGTTQVAAICQSPDQLNGRSVTSLIEEFNCSKSPWKETEIYDHFSFWFINDPLFFFPFYSTQPPSTI